MAAGYAVWICDGRGRRIAPLDGIVSVSYARLINGVGWFSLVHDATLDPALLQVDNQIHIERRPRYRDRMAIDFVGFLRYWEMLYENNTDTFIMRGPDQNDLLDRRIVASAAGTALAQATSIAADDAMKDIFNENYIGGAADSDRDWSALGLTVQADATAGATVDRGFAWRLGLATMQEMADLSRTAGKAGSTETYFSLDVNDVDEDTGVVSFEYRTTIDIPGRDLTDSGGLPPVVFGPGFGNVTRSKLSFDYRNERNFIYAGGQGEGSQRLVQTASDTDRINASPYGRRELFVDARMDGSAAAVQAAANAKLAEYRPIVRYEATLQDTAQARYGVDWNLGDKVTIRDHGREFEGIINMVYVQYSEGGEVINVKVVSEDV